MTGLKHLLLGLSLTLVAGPALAAAPPTSRGETTSGIADVVLSSDSGLSGRFLDGEGRPVDGAIVALSRNRTVIARTATGSGGAYHLPQVEQGVYQLTLGTQTQTVRVWNPQLAPPAAQQLLTTVRGDEVVRAQLGLASFGSTAGIVGGAAGVVGAGAGGYSVTQSMDAQDEADAAVKEAAALREMLNAMMSP
jgi:hypothetical protein